MDIKFKLVIWVPVLRLISYVKGKVGLGVNSDQTVEDDGAVDMASLYLFDGCGLIKIQSTHPVVKGDNFRAAQHK